METPSHPLAKLYGVYCIWHVVELQNVKTEGRMIETVHYKLSLNVL